MCRNSDENLKRRAAVRRELATMPPCCLLLIDEVHFVSKNLVANYEWFPKGKYNIIVSSQRDNNQSFSLIMGIKIQGVIYYKLINTKQEDAVNSNIFFDFLINLVERKQQHEIFFLIMLLLINLPW